MYVYFNPNPKGNRVGDCVIRAISVALNVEWEQAYIELAIQGFLEKDMPSSNHVWSTYLQNKGFKREVIPDGDCYTVKDFCDNAPLGTYLLATGTHVVTVINGDYLDTWDSGDEVPIFYFREEK